MVAVILLRHLIFIYFISLYPVQPWENVHVAFQHVNVQVLHVLFMVLRVQLEVKSLDEERGKLRGSGGEDRYI